MILLTLFFSPSFSHLHPLTIAQQLPHGEWGGEWGLTHASLETCEASLDTYSNVPHSTLTKTTKSSGKPLQKNWRLLQQQKGGLKLEWDVQHAHIPQNLWSYSVCPNQFSTGIRATKCPFCADTVCYVSLSQTNQNQGGAGLTTWTLSIMAEERLILVVTDNPIIYDLILKAYHDQYKKLTWFPSIVLTDLSEANRE